jgi:hypothetical protein
MKHGTLHFFNDVAFTMQVIMDPFFSHIMFNLYNVIVYFF